MIRFLEIRTTKRTELVDLGHEIRDLVLSSGLTEGAVHMFCLHTTCALTVNENADPDVGTDLIWKMGQLVPKNDSEYRHEEGNSDAHLKTSLFGSSLTLIIHRGDLVLGKWQGIFLVEWDGPRTRTVVLRICS